MLHGNISSAVIKLTIIQPILCTYIKLIELQVNEHLSVPEQYIINEDHRVNVAQHERQSCEHVHWQGAQRHDVLLEPAVFILHYPV